MISVSISDLRLDEYIQAYKCGQRRRAEVGHPLPPGGGEDVMEWQQCSERSCCKPVGNHHPETCATK